MPVAASAFVIHQHGFNIAAGVGVGTVGVISLAVTSPIITLIGGLVAYKLAGLIMEPVGSIFVGAASVAGTVAGVAAGTAIGATVGLISGTLSSS